MNDGWEETILFLNKLNRNWPKYYELVENERQLIENEARCE